MSILAMVLLSGIGFIIAYHTYGRWLATRIFRLSPDHQTPAKFKADGVDYVATRKGVVFGHHFTSIAGTGPIVGPAIGILWGWLPALLWVVLGSVFIGAVHDFGSLVVSMRNDGVSVGDIAGRLVTRRVRLLFLLVLLVSLTIVLAIFCLVIASVFRLYPAAIFPVFIQIPIAVGIGLWIHRKGGNILFPSLAALVLMYLSIIFGNVGPLGAFNAAMAKMPIIAWTAILLVYSFIASILPVWILLQPRDYINSHQLFAAMGLILLGLAAAAIFGGNPPVAGAERTTLHMIAPAFQWNPKGAPFLFPFLFITIACGAISGFHSLVSSGTSSKQINSEPDALLVGYGSMLTEAFLAVLVIAACGAGIGLGLKTGDSPVLTGHAAWISRYESWGAAGSLSAKLGSFVEGAGNFIETLHIPPGIAVAVMGVLVASFAGTTLDTACRIQRYVIQELAHTISVPHAGGSRKKFTPFRFLTNRYAATGLAVILALALAALPMPGKPWSMATAGTGGMILWPMFGATNQLLAGLAFMVIAFYLWRRRKPVWFIILPFIFMLVMPMVAMVMLCFTGNGIGRGWVFSEVKNWPLLVIGLLTIVFEIWMIVEALILFPKVAGVLETSGEPRAD